MPPSWLVSQQDQDQVRSHRISLQLELLPVRFIEKWAPISIRALNTLDPESTGSQCMDIHKNQVTSKWISIKGWIIEDISVKHGYLFMGIYCWRISIAESPCMDIPAWISMWISTFVWIILQSDIQKSWISMLIYVHFWKSIHGYAMDSQTRVNREELILLILANHENRCSPFVKSSGICITFRFKGWKL